MPEKDLENFSAPKSKLSVLPTWEDRILSVWNSLKIRSSRFRFQTPKSIHIKFFPYSNGNNSLRYEKGDLFAKFHSSVRETSPQIADSLLHLLVSRLLRLKVKPEWKEDVMEFLNSLPETKQNKIPDLPSRGRTYDLREIMEKIASVYFPKIDLKRLNIFWSDRIGKRRLGSYDKQTMSIRMSPILDHPQVPRYVLEHVVHHEILHHILPVRRVRGKNSIHSPLFKQKEKEYYSYKEAIVWLKMEYPRFLRRQ